MVGRIAEQPKSEASPLASLYAPVAEELQQAERILRRTMRSDYPYVDELVRYGCLLGGKRLRPALLLLSAKACGRVTGTASDAGSRRRNGPHGHTGARRCVG